MIITIIGKGFVGKATSILENENVQIWFYDIVPDLCIPKNITYKMINEKSDIIFICVPTPMNLDGSCNTKIIESVLSHLHHPHIILRSTVPIGFCDRHQLYFMPEFLTEKNWPQDFKNNPVWIFGYFENISEKTKNEFISITSQLIDFSHQAGKIQSNQKKYYLNKEAELIKLIRNNFLSTKVSFFNEMYDLCLKLNIDYTNVQSGVGDDKRIGYSHTNMDNTIRGYGGTCFPKDTNSLYHIFQENNIKSHILEANLIRNEYNDRKNKDWLFSYNRAITNYSGKIVLIINPDNPIFPESNMQKIIFNPLYIEEETQDNIHIQKWNPDYKIFMPRVDEVIYYLRDSDKIGLQIKEIQNILIFVSIYNLSFKIIFNLSIKHLEFYMDWIKNEYPSTDFILHKS